MATQQRLLRGLATCLTLLMVVISMPRDVSAQDDHRSSLLSDVVRGTLLDPTTYAPAILNYDATMRDWKTSQPLFQNGFVEHNAGFTVSGLSNGQPVSYSAGKQQVLRDALTVLQMSAVQNVSERLVEHVLRERYPEHRTMVKALGWIERISVASVMSYQMSAAHYRQARQNQALAAQLGID